MWEMSWRLKSRTWSRIQDTRVKAIKADYSAVFIAAILEGMDVGSEEILFGRVQKRSC